MGSEVYPPVAFDFDTYVSMNCCIFATLLNVLGCQRIINPWIPLCIVLYINSLWVGGGAGVHNHARVGCYLVQDTYGNGKIALLGDVDFLGRIIAKNINDLPICLENHIRVLVLPVPGDACHLDAVGEGISWYVPELRALLFQ